MRWLGVLAVAGVLAACGGDGGDHPDAALFCERLDRLTEHDPFLAFGATATPAEIELAFQALVERADELVDSAPDEGRGAARDYADAARALEGLLEDAGYDGAQVDSRAYRDEQLKYAEAADRLLRYLDTEC
jgi:hypothetical protein